MTIPEIQEELLRQEYPFLMPGHDPDIEQYFHLRATNRSGEALNLYQYRLRPRYPNDEFRTMLMRCYRNRDPAYRVLLIRAFKALAERSIERVKRVIGYIADKAESYNARDIYSTIKAVESIMAVLPKEHYAAIAGIERFSRYAEALGLRERAVHRAVDLVRSYLTDSLTVVTMERYRREAAHRRKQEDERRRLVKADWESYETQKKRGSSSGAMIDLSAVTFSRSDLARIEISKNFVRVEDQTLAYCLKYWNLIADPAFERILFLYSRKYNVKNHDIYLTIRLGRQNNKRDEEILASVMAALVTGYYYSIQGDRYLQRQWTVLKDTLQPPPVVKSAAPRKKNIWKKKTSSAQTAALQVPADNAKTEPVKAIRRKDAPDAKTGKRGKRAAPVSKPEAPPKPAAQPAGTQPPPASGSAAPESIPKPARIQPIPLRPVSAPPPPVMTAKKPTGSVSDQLKELSGRSYDVSHDPFMDKVMPVIRNILKTGRGLFFSPPVEAENLIFKFLRDHYSDPYMNWAESEERNTLKSMGFDLESLEPIIRECFRKL
jgi:hypothetical protein